MMPISPLISRYDGDGQTYDSEWSGVARIHDGTVSGSAVLLASGLQLLTAAHVTADLALDKSEVVFETASGTVTRHIQSMESYPGALIENSGIWDDLALVTLDQAAPEGAERYDIYTGTDEIGQTATIVGYGRAQDIYGTQLFENRPTKRAGENTIDSTGAALAANGWQGSLSKQLIYDYDDGTVAHDTLGDLLGISNSGLGGVEAMITPGDSGGGLFVEQGGKYQLAGINSYVTRWPATDLTSQPDSSVGDIGADTRVSSYSEWIETSTGQLQQPIAQTDTSPPHDQVPLQVMEGEGVYFLVDLPRPATEASSVEFFTRDGTATAGMDYIATRGVINLAPGEQSAKIWVQTLADNLVEGDETFSMVLVNPTGANFPDGLTELTAQRTIVDDISLVGVTHLTFALFG